jgi:hypothetical protein
MLNVFHRFILLNTIHFIIFLIKTALIALASSMANMAAEVNTLQAADAAAT